MTTNDWLIKTKTENPELSKFITKLEAFISDSGLNNARLENAVEIGLKNIESEVKKSFIPDKNVENKEDNN